MVNVHCLNNIASVGLDLFSDDYNMESSYEDAQAVLVRSAKMHDMELNDHLLAIARAGAGVNNIPLDKCAEAGIVVFPYLHNKTNRIRCFYIHYTIQKL